VHELYSVSELANELGVTPRALRFYEDKGLLAPQRAGNTRVYTSRDRGRLMLILRGKRLGFTLREVREWLDLYEPGAGQAAQMTRLKDKLRQRIATLEQQRGDLDATLAELREILGEVNRRPEGGPSVTRVTGG
jgi:DNA-binding transcriptional MerR regulator